MDMNIGARLKELRISKNMFQAEIAEKLGVKQNTYSRYENNLIRPDYEALVMLAELFDVTTDYLLGRTDAEY